MNLDRETRRALGYGDAWEQLVLRFPPRLVHDDRHRAKKEAAEDAALFRRCHVKYRTEAERLEARRRQTREAMQRARAKARAA